MTPADTAAGARFCSPGRAARFLAAVLEDEALAPILGMGTFLRGGRLASDVLEFWLAWVGSGVYPADSTGWEKLLGGLGAP